MGCTIIWENNGSNLRYKEICNILVSSFRIENNGRVCSLLKEGWIIIKVIIRHRKENSYYQYCLGKPDLSTENDQ